MGMEKVPGGDKANGQPGKETKEVRPQIGSLSAAADHSEQGQTGEQRQQTSLQAGHAALEARARKDADGSEQGGGTPDGLVMVGLKISIEPISENSRQKNQQPGPSAAVRPAEPGEKDRGHDQIRDKMKIIGMQSQGRHGSPPLAVEDFSGMGASQLDPVNRRQAQYGRVDQGQIVKSGEDQKD